LRSLKPARQNHEDMGALRRPLLWLSAVTTNPGDWQNKLMPRRRIEPPMSQTSITPRTSVTSQTSPTPQTSTTPIKLRRLFFGLDARSQSQALQGLQQQLALPASPVVTDNLHLTLLFLGAVDEELLPRLCQLGCQVASQRAGFRVVLDQLGLFPQAKVAWVGPSQAPRQLLCSGLIIPDTVLGGKVATVTRGVQ